MVMSNGNFPSPDQLRVILSAAIKAPSGHNYQPWSFVVRNNRLSIILETTDATIYNFKERGSLTALGALTESIILTAPTFGFEAEHKFTYDRTRPGDPAVQIDLTATEPRSVLYADALAVRTTNRKPYHDEPIPEPVKRAVLGTLSVTPSINAYYVGEAGRRKAIAYQLAKADTLMLSQPDVYAAVFPHVIWTEEEEWKRREGLYVSTLELPPPAESAFRFFAKHPRLARLAGLFGFGHIIAAANASTYSHGGALILFTIPNFSDSSFFELGRALLRAWACATHHGLSAQPIGGTIFLAARASEGDANTLTSRAQTMLVNAEKISRTLFGVAEKEMAGIVLRIGYSDPPSATSSRKEPRIEYL